MAFPATGYQPSGLELLKTHADELLERGHGLETLQWQLSAIDGPPGARVLLSQSE